MNSRNNQTLCKACGEPTVDGCGLPVDSTGRFVHNGYTGEWGGVPACRGCHEVHKAGGPDALAAHVKATEELGIELERYRDALAAISKTIRGLER